ncbi:WD40 repeat-like protein [Lichtheimia hyalospora FSU 10163]|nr:WD40 repeat-like protein [Lichtheimia hyalospora FSU 10163]
MDTTSAKKKLKISDNVTVNKSKDEKDLESFLFGDMDDQVWDRAGHELSDQEQDEDDQAQSSANEDENAEEAFFFDSGPGFVMDSEPTPSGAVDREDHEMTERIHDDESGEDEDEESEPEESNYGYLRKPAWEDDDDRRLLVSLQSNTRLRKLRKDVDEDVVDGIEYERRLRAFHNKMYARPAWAKLPSEKREGEEDEEEAFDEDNLADEDRVDLLKSTYGILELQNRRNLLDPEQLAVKRQKNANIQAQSKKRINTLAFHPNAQVMMAGGEDKTLRLFQIDGRVNPKIQSVFFKDLKVTCAAFNPSGDQVIISGRQPFYYIYDVQAGSVDRCPYIWGRNEQSLESFTMSPCGKYTAFRGKGGHIVLVSTLTKQWVGDFKMDRSVEGMAWSSDGKYLHSIANNGQVYQWDVGQRECVNRWIDDGAVRSTALGVSRDDRFYATGSSSGVVNLYNDRVLDPDNNRPTPFKSLGNLTTPIDNIKFNYDSQLMAISSHDTRDALRMVHLPSGSVYQNWPTERTPFGRITTMDFSANSDYLAVGNDLGRIVLYSLNDYAL